MVPIWEAVFEEMALGNLTSEGRDFFVVDSPLPGAVVEGVILLITFVAIEFALLFFSFKVRGCFETLAGLRAFYMDSRPTTSFDFVTFFKDLRTAFYPAAFAFWLPASSYRELELLNSPEPKENWTFLVDCGGWTMIILVPSCAW